MHIVHQEVNAVVTSTTRKPIYTNVLILRKKKKKTPDFTSLYQSYSEFIYIFRNFGANLELKLFVENPWVITFLDSVAHRYKASAFKTENLSYYFGLKRH